MELLSAEFFSALLAIIVIDLVLAGDNAIVIALAARNLPADLRKKAIIWGTVGAIAVRTAMTLVVVWLLKVPGLMLLGGALLVWIAYKLLADNDGDGHDVSAANSFWGAMKTIVVADAVMGLDNVLAVAGAAHGSFMLVVIGLLISIPIVIWGSQIILKYVERYPGIIYIGGAVLAWTAVKMIISEPLVKDYFDTYPALAGLAYIAIIGGVLGGGFWVNHVPACGRARCGRAGACCGRCHPPASPGGCFSQFAPGSRTCHRSSCSRGEIGGTSAARSCAVFPIYRSFCESA
jgi:YjbE family integral membrane protein